MTHKKLYRSNNKLVAGVCAGLAEYFDHDPTLWRLGFVLFLVLTGLMPGLLLYILAWVIIPQAPERIITD
ncbi:MAG: PspC domain-containing protein [Candidatus Paceibacterota bacterium]